MDPVFCKFMQLNTFVLWGSVQARDTTIYMTYVQFCEIFQPICDSYRRGVRFSCGRVEPYMVNPKNEDVVEQVPLSWRGLSVEFKSNVPDYTLRHFGDAHISMDALLKPWPDYVRLPSTLHRPLLPGQSVEIEYHDTRQKLAALIASNDVCMANYRGLTTRLKTVDMLRSLEADNTSYFQCLPRDIINYVLLPYMLQGVKY